MKNLKKKYLELYLKHGFYFRNADIGPTWTQHLKIQQFKYSCWPNVGPTTSTNGEVVGPMMVQHILADCNRVIFLNIKV